MSSVARSRPESTLAVVNAVLALGAADPTYAQLAAVCGLSKRTIDNVVGDLRGRGLLKTAPVALGGRWGVVLSVVLGAETCVGALVDANGIATSHAELERLPGQRHAKPAELRARIRDVSVSVLGEGARNPTVCPDGRLPLLGVVTAWPAPVRGSKRPAGSVMDPAWLSLDYPTLPEAVAEELGMPTERSHAINDANADAIALAFDDSRSRAAEALHRGDTQDGGHSPPAPWRIGLVVHLGGAIGAATILRAPDSVGRAGFIDSTLLGGARSLAGELAHLPLDPSAVTELNERGKWVGGLAPIPLDTPCSCGRPGHLEAYAGGNAFVARMEDSGISRGELLALMASARSAESPDTYEIEDPRIETALEDLGRLIGRSLTAPVLLLDPHILTITGSLGVGPVVRGIEAERETWRHVFGDALRIEPIDARRRESLTIRGAALAVHRAQVHRRLPALLSSAAGLEELTIAW